MAAALWECRKTYRHEQNSYICTSDVDMSMAAQYNRIVLMKTTHEFVSPHISHTCVHTPCQDNKPDEASSHHCHICITRSAQLISAFKPIRSETHLALFFLYGTSSFILHKQMSNY